MLKAYSVTIYDKMKDNMAKCVVEAASEEEAINKALDFFGDRKDNCDFVWLTELPNKWNAIYEWEISIIGLQ